MMFAWLRFPGLASGKWTIQGYDSFSEVIYSLPGSYRSAAKARRAAREFLHTLSQLQPAAVPGEERPVGIRDRVYIVRPDGAHYSYVPGWQERHPQTLREPLGR
jgi:hypothetical protein